MKVHQVLKLKGKADKTTAHSQAENIKYKAWSSDPSPLCTYLKKNFVFNFKKNVFFESTACLDYNSLLLPNFLDSPPFNLISPPPQDQNMWVIHQEPPS